MIYIGVDVGKSGALAIIYEDSTTKVLDFDDPELLLELSDINEPVIAYIEKVSSMPNQGVASTFSFGTNYGWWQGVMDALGIPYELVRPQEWMKSLTIPTSIKKPTKEQKSQNLKARKKAINDTARRLFPKEELVTHRGRILDGRSDALMIANYARKTYDR